MADIELVIKIPEELYNMACNYPEMVLAGYPQCIREGTPLPKGHSDLIDRNELLRQPIDTANYPSNYVRLAKAIIEADKEEKQNEVT